MTSPENTEAIGVGAEEIVSQARRLGLSWTLIPATAATVSGTSSNAWPPSNTWVVQDNDSSPTRAISLIGPVASGARVMVLHVPPQGNYILGTIGVGGPSGIGASAWTDYGTPSTIWTSTGTQPSIGDGLIVARYRLIDSRTCAFRIKVNPGSTTTFGTGTYRFLLPFTVADEQVGVALFRDNSAALQYGGFSAWLQSGTTILTVSNSAAANWSPTVPATWASADRAEISGVYEIT